MSKPTERIPSDTPTAADPAAQSAGQGGPRIEVDDSKTVTCYANFCRVTGTPEELIIDFGLNPQPFIMPPPHPVPIAQRIVTNYYTAKRMLHALQLTLQRHEAVFGVLEPDVQKRVVGGR
ncbi:MAG TPA: DUF3467 domain-containing protein [Pirellulales bacterium]|nr:DUF3467 domain-containing protein [Pirellulales bacterium]